MITIFRKPIIIARLSTLTNAITIGGMCWCGSVDKNSCVESSTEEIDIDKLVEYAALQRILLLLGKFVD